jgi:hypothetical protein
MPENDFSSGEIASAVTDSAAAVASPAQHTAESTERAEPQRDAAVDPAKTTTTDSDRYKGWIPPDAHKRIVDGFHHDLDQVAWAKGLSREEVEEAMVLRRQQARGADRDAAPKEPQPDVKDERGELFYSPLQAAKWSDWKAERARAELRAEFEERFGPMESSFEETRQLNSLSQQIQQATAWPGFTDHAPAITELIRQNNAERARNPRIPKLSLHEAYIQIVPGKLAASRDTLLADEKKKWLAELNNTTEAVTKSDINPSRSTHSTRKKDSDMSFGELIADEVAKKKAS